MRVHVPAISVPYWSTARASPRAVAVADWHTARRRAKSPDRTHLVVRANEPPSLLRVDVAAHLALEVDPVQPSLVRVHALRVLELEHGYPALVGFVPEPDRD